MSLEHLVNGRHRLDADTARIHRPLHVSSIFSQHFQWRCWSQCSGVHFAYIGRMDVVGETRRLRAFIEPKRIWPNQEGLCTYLGLCASTAPDNSHDMHVSSCDFGLAGKSPRS